MHILTSKFGEFEPPEDFKAGDEIVIEGRRLRLQRVLSREGSTPDHAVLMDVSKVPERGKMLTNTVYLEPDGLEQLRALAYKTRVPMAAYIREGIDKILAKNANILNKGN